MKKLISLTLLVLLFACNGNQNDEIESLIIHSEAQLGYALQNINGQCSDELVSPRSMEDDSVRLVPAEDWTSGFFPGNLWMMYELTGHKKWSKAALRHTLPLEPEKWNGSNHDIGFKMYCSFGQAVKYYDNPEYKEILIQSAKTLSSRYNPIVGCICSWNSTPNTSQWKFPVIIDNMMNLELLMWAAKETGNDSFREIAVKHAQTTMQHHFRNDYSCYHVVDYDPKTGEVLNKNTHQGFADESDWARGQAWAVYGFTMMYRETGLDEFLGQAKKIADYLLSVNGIKDGAMPYWDFKAPNIPNEPYDVSAAAVIASALFELYEYSNNKAYLTAAIKLFITMSSPEFLAKVGENGGFLLKHSTGSKPYESEVDVPLVYADYYFLETLIKYKKYKEQCRLKQ